MFSRQGLPEHIATKTEKIDGKSIHYWYDRRLFEAFDSTIFDPDAARAGDEQPVALKGRGKVYALRHGEREVILRHYWRGGRIRRVMKDRFVFWSLRGSRPLREFMLLDHMRGLGLPVPRPAAARLTRYGWYYRADIVMEKIPDAEILLAVIARRALPVKTWRDIGVCIRRLHDADIQHVDLSPRNIMLDGALSPWIIDFDNCRLRRWGNWRAKGIARLERSMGRHMRQRRLNVTPQDWRALLDGYAAGTG